MYFYSLARLAVAIRFKVARLRRGWRRLYGLSSPGQRSPNGSRRHRTRSRNVDSANLWRAIFVLSIVSWIVPIVVSSSWSNLPLTDQTNQPTGASTPQQLQILSKSTSLEIVTSSVIIFLVGLGVWAAYFYFKSRPTHIITQFESIDDEADMKRLASSLTHSFVTHLKDIGTQLSRRQEETLSTRLENPLTLFVTSGQDADLVQDLRSLSDFGAGNVKLPLSGLLSLLIFNTAQVRIKGTVQRTEDGTVQVWIEMYRRRTRGTVEVARAEVPTSVAGFIDEKRLNKTARELAIKLTQKLGEFSHLASNPDSLDLLLKGLTASAQRNWWYAIACYGRVTEIEETLRGRYALGNYHLGATLLAQGMPEQAISYLLKAVATTPAIPEAYYTLAASLIAQYAEKPAEPITIRRSSFEQARDWLDKAIELRPEFAEAYYLLGCVLYQEAKQLERERGTDKRLSKIPELRKYFEATRKFRIAIRLYDVQMQRKINEAVDELSDFERAEKLRDRMTIQHHWADAFRSIGLYHEAITLYDEARKGIGSHTHNLIDIAMTHCLWGKWKAAYDFVGKELLNTPEGSLSADAHLYRGWASAALARRWFISRHEKHRYSNEALQRLDMAISLRPRFMAVRDQTHWIRTWQILVGKAGDKIDKTKWENSMKDAVNPTNDKNGNIASLALDDITKPVLSQWLYLKMQGYGFYGDIRTKLLGPMDAEGITTPHHQLYGTAPVQYREDCSLHKKLPILRIQLAEKLHSIDSNRDSLDTLRLDSNLEIGKAAFGVWNTLLQSIEEIFLQLNPTLKRPATNGFNIQPSSSVPSLTYSHRWTTEHFLEVADLTCKTLAACEAYAALTYVAGISSQLGEHWFNLWKDAFADKKDFRLSTLVIRYRYMSLVSWLSLGISRLSEEQLPIVEKRALERSTLVLNPANFTFAHIEKEIRDRSTGALVPLYTFVRATNHRRAKRFSAAISDFNTLLSFADQFDPKIYDQFGPGLGITQDRETLNVESPSFDKLPIRKQLYYMERVCGRQQFEDFIDKSKIYHELAITYAEMGDYKSAIVHITDALTWSTYSDEDFQNTLLLVDYLYRLDRFQEALAVVEEGLERLTSDFGSIEDTSSIDTTTLLELKFRVYECVLLTRIEEHSAALELGLSIRKRYTRTKHTSTTQEQPSEVQKTQDQSGSLSVESPKLTSLFDIFSAARPKSKERQLTQPSSISINLEDVIKNHVTFAGFQFDVINQDISQQIAETGSAVNGEAIKEDHRKFTQARNTWEAIIEIASIYNNIAYNMAKLNRTLNEASIHVSIAIAALNYLKQCVIEPAGFNQENTSLFDQLEEYLAKYYDTLAWVNYRNHRSQNDKNNDTLDVAIEYLADSAISFDATNPVPHYHLSRLYTMRCEELWTQFIQPADGNNADLEEISFSLRRAFHHWGIANRLDVNQRLQTKMRDVRKQLGDFETKWNLARTQGFARALEERSSKPRNDSFECYI
jgi:tetratricopeptide (TPR) repeat protein